MGGGGIVGAVTDVKCNSTFSHFPIFAYKYPGYNWITHPCKVDNQREGIFYHLIFLIFLSKIAKRSKHVQDNKKTNGVPEEVTLFSKMVQEAGLHLNEGQTHDELGKNNPSNSYSPLSSLYATRDVLQERCLCLNSRNSILMT